MTIFLVDIEAVSTRYTCEWKDHVPSILEQLGHTVKVIASNDAIAAATTPGAFLNFGGTNIYKARQVEQIGQLFCAGEIKNGDHFLFTDAWHPGIVNLKYMSELLQIPVTIHALWHAGSYDPQDFLGRLIGDASWVRHAEKSFFYAIDHNYFASEFHANMFCNTLLGLDPTEVTTNKIIRTGWPMEYMSEILRPYTGKTKRNLILFPHRIAPEKQVEIFRDLAKHLPQYEFVVCQDIELSKEEYHTLLSEAKIVFSANLQETLGISCYEGTLVDAIPMVPDRLSYSEMHDDIFKYPSEWTESFESYEIFRPNLCQLIMQHMDCYVTRLPWVNRQKKTLTEDFFSADALYERLSNEYND